MGLDVQTWGLKTYHFRWEGYWHDNAASNRQMEYLSDKHFLSSFIIYLAVHKILCLSTVWQVIHSQSQTENVLVRSLLVNLGRDLVFTSHPSPLPPTQLAKMDLCRNNWFFVSKGMSCRWVTSECFTFDWSVGEFKKGTHSGGCWGLGMKLKWGIFLLSDSLSCYCLGSWTVKWISVLCFRALDLPQSRDIERSLCFFTFSNILRETV